MFLFYNKAAKLYWLLHHLHCTVTGITSLPLKVFLSQHGLTQERKKGQFYLPIGVQGRMYVPLREFLASLG